MGLRSMRGKINSWCCTGIILLLLPVPAGMVSAEEDHATARHLLESGDILPLEKILATVRKTHPGKVLEVELEKEAGRVIYEMEILDNNGMVHKLYVDARTSEVLTTKLDD